MKLSQEEIEAQLAEVRRSYLASLDSKRDSIVEQWSALCEQWNEETFQSMYLIIHTLAGSAETFGLEQLTQDARTLVNLFKQYANELPPSGKLLMTLNAGIEHLITSMNQGLSK